jgi:hypothetical protein
VHLGRRGDAKLLEQRLDLGVDLGGLSDVRDDLVASGVVVPSPEWLQCRGSKWVLRIDGGGVRNESELRRGA